MDTVKPSVPFRVEVVEGGIPEAADLYWPPRSLGFQMSPVFSTEGLPLLFSVKNPLKEGGEDCAWPSSKGGSRAV